MNLPPVGLSQLPPIYDHIAVVAAQVGLQPSIETLVNWDRSP